MKCPDTNKTVERKIIVLNAPVDVMTHRILLAVQKELGLPNLSAVLARIASDYWRGYSSPIGHTGFPSE